MRHRRETNNPSLPLSLKQGAGQAVQCKKHCTCFLKFWIGLLYSKLLCQIQVFECGNIFLYELSLHEA